MVQFRGDWNLFTALSRFVMNMQSSWTYRRRRVNREPRRERRPGRYLYFARNREPHLTLVAMSRAKLREPVLSVKKTDIERE